MATVNIVLGQVNGGSASGGTMPILNGRSAVSENLTSSGTSAASNLVSSGRVGDVFVVTPIGGGVYVKIAAAPVAAVAGIYIPDGVPMAFAAVSGDKVAVINA